MTSQSWRQILLLVLWDVLCRFLNDLETQISKLKTIKEICLSTQKIQRFGILILLLKINFQGLDHCKTVYDQSLLYVGSVDRDQSKEDKIWK